MSTRQRTSKAGFAQLESAREFELAPTELRRSLQPSLATGTAIERYGRIWRMGRLQYTDRAITGRIGYERRGELAELWDPAAGDFREQRNREGLTSPFALDPETLVVVFQLRPGRIEHHSFTGAFRALLNEALGAPIWQLRPVVQGVPFERWVDSVDRVARLEVKIERPNPNYHGRQQVERIVEGARAQLVRIAFEAQEDQSLDLNDDLIREAIEHAAQDYGSVKATAEIDTPVGRQPSVWRSDREGAALEARVPIDPESREATGEALAAELPEVEADASPEVIDAELRGEWLVPDNEDSEEEA